MYTIGCEHILVKKVTAACVQTALVTKKSPPLLLYRFSLFKSCYSSKKKSPPIMYRLLSIKSTVCCEQILVEKGHRCLGTDSCKSSLQFAVFRFVCTALLVVYRLL